jgi:hypothetical protein
LYATDHHIFPLTVYIESERKDFFVARYQRLGRAPVGLTTTIKKGKHIVLFLDGRREENIQKKEREDFSHILKDLFEDTDRFSSSMVVPLYVRGANITQRKKR